MAWYGLVWQHGMAGYGSRVWQSLAGYGRAGEGTKPGPDTTRYSTSAGLHNNDSLVSGSGLVCESSPTSALQRAASQALRLQLTAERRGAWRLGGSTANTSLRTPTRTKTETILTIQFQNSNVFSMYEIYSGIPNV